MQKSWKNSKHLYTLHLDVSVVSSLPFIFPLAEPFESILQISQFTPKYSSQYLLQKVFLLNNHYTVITLRNWTLMQFYYLICSPYSNFPSCLHNVFCFVCIVSNHELHIVFSCLFFKISSNMEESFFFLSFVTLLYFKISDKLSLMCVSFYLSYSSFELVLIRIL